MLCQKKWFYFRTPYITIVMMMMKIFILRACHNVYIAAIITIKEMHILL